MILPLALLIMTFFSLMSIILGSTFSVYTNTTTVSNSQLINGSSTSFSIPDITYTLDLSQLSISIGFLTIIVIAVAIGVGITVLGSGLNTTSARYILVITSYASIWGFLTILSAPLITSIEIYGTLIYTFITLMYILGVVQKLSQR